MFGWFIGRNKGFQPNTLPDLKLWLPADRIGVQGYSLDFDGTDDFVQANNVITAYPFTMECWVRLDVTNVGQRILAISNTTAGNVRYSLFYFQTDGKFYIQIQNTTTFSSGSTTTASANTWYHLAAVFESDTSRKLYVNGVLEATGTDNVTFNNSADNKVNMGRHFSASLFLNGKLSDVRIWNTARTAQEIADNYQKRLIGNESGLVGYWKLDKGSGTTVADSTTNANAGTITGAVWDNSEPFTEPIDDGTAVRIWADQSGNGYDATQSTTAARPTYIASGFNGLPVVRFDGTDDHLGFSGGALSLLKNVAGATIFVAVKYSATAVNAPSFFASRNSSSTSVRILIRTSTAPKYNMQATRLDADTAINMNSVQATNTNSVVIQTAKADYQNQTLEQFINGTLDGSTTFATSGNTENADSLAIFLGRVSATYLTGDIAEIIVYNRALNTSELAQVHRYLARKWGIALA
jgi:hypothetical protein